MGRFPGGIRGTFVIEKINKTFFKLEMFNIFKKSMKNFFENFKGIFRIFEFFNFLERFRENLDNFGQLDVSEVSN